MPTILPPSNQFGDAFYGGAVTGGGDVAGPFYFAWINAGEAFGPQHHVMHEFIFSFELDQSEGNFASLNIEIENPGVGGLLRPGRKLRCWFAWFNPETEEIEPLFTGRLVAVPTNLQSRVVSLQFTAQPDDFDAAKAEIAAEIRAYGLPYWDPVFVDESHEEDPDAVLEAIPKLWHVDRLTLETTLSDILVGEDGVVAFEEGEAFDDGLDVQLNDAPLDAVEVDATVTWKQSHVGTIDMGGYFFEGRIDGLASEWPKPGGSLSGGYSVVSASFVGYRINLTQVNITYVYENKEKEPTDGDLMSHNESYSGVPRGDLRFATRTKVTQANPEDGQGYEVDLARVGISVGQGLGRAKASLVLGYGANRDWEERLTFTVHSDLQPVLRAGNDARVTERIVISGRDVVEFGLLGSTATSYFRWPRGDVSVRHLILRAVARLKLGGRVVNVTWGCTFARATEFTCRKSAALADKRLQGGYAIGKIIAYKMAGNGDSGVFDGSVTIGCTVGLGNAIVEVAGDPTYVEEGYVTRPYQMYENSVIAIGANDVGYSPPIIVPNDDGLIFPLTKRQVVLREQTIKEALPGPEDQEPPSTVFEVIGGPQPEQTNRPGAQIDALIAKAEVEAQRAAERAGRDIVYFEMELKAIDKGKFTTESTVKVQNLVLPKQYDLTTAEVALLPGLVGPGDQFLPPTVS